MFDPSTKKLWSFVLALPLATFACAKGSSSESAPTARSSGPEVLSAEPTKPSPTPSASAALPETNWSGSYTAKIGAVEPPKNANEKVWTLDPGTAAVGKGTVDLSVHNRGETQGDSKGPLGDMTISGVYDGKELRANLVPKDPRTDGAMTGFMLLSMEGDALKGTMRVSGRDGRIVRDAVVELAKK